ncbi:hypothetical protein AB7M17_007371 [Bradyrhizobium sp. USDA 377]
MMLELGEAVYGFPSDQFWIFLTDLNEPEDNSLRLMVAEAKTLGDVEHSLFPASSTRPIVITEDSRRFEFVWKDYVAYLVRNESFASLEEGQPTGIFLEKQSSAYLRFLDETTFATAVMNKPIRHWVVNCLNHCIDVASFSEPVVRELLAEPNDGGGAVKAN